jgi:anti-sigma regulatory factor (Ser/Thr protein kinase)
MEGRYALARHHAGAAQELAQSRSDPAGGFSHAALFYQGTDEYLTALAEFAREDPRAPIQALLPWSKLMRARPVLSVMPARTQLADITELGSNPARLIPAGLSFADQHAGERVRCLWEPAWPGRSSAELSEVARHEALCGLAFAGRPVTLLCLYDLSTLSADLIAEVEHTHPVLISAGTRDSSQAFLGAGVVPPGCDDPLPAAPATAESLGFTDQLTAVRVFAARHAAAAGLSPDRTRDLTLAVSEIAANALSHANGGTIRAWRADGGLTCQIEDSGHITDPLAGRFQRPPDVPGGHGLWLVNQVCDLVERRSGPAGTVTRLQMRTI